MFNGLLIGYVGSDAEVKSTNGKEFTAFRVANTEKWIDAAGLPHENTIWVDCVLNGKPNVVPYLTKGTLVYVQGALSLRVYSSPKERCMKAGCTINVSKIELLGGRTDDVPSRLYRAVNGEMVPVTKYYGVPQQFDEKNKPIVDNLVDDRGSKYVADINGWVSKQVEGQGTV